MVEKKLQSSDRYDRQVHEDFPIPYNAFEELICHSANFEEVSEVEKPVNGANQQESDDEETHNPKADAPIILTVSIKSEGKGLSLIFKGTMHAPKKRTNTTPDFCKNKAAVSGETGRNEITKLHNKENPELLE